MAKDDPYFRLRIPEPLLKKVQAAAGASNRSATAEILQRLEDSFAPKVADPETLALLMDLMRQAAEDALAKMPVKPRTEEEVADLVAETKQGGGSRKAAGVGRCAGPIGGGNVFYLNYLDK